MPVTNIRIFLFSLIGGILGAIISGVTSCCSQRPEPIDDAVNAGQIQNRFPEWDYSRSPNNSTTPRLPNNVYNQRNSWPTPATDRQPSTPSNSF